ncbi:MAG TPA: RNA polymerase sigma factor [Flavitalea sp.]|nr:RNA polymerase sigma factor [Flavitalea sp.]
MTERDYNECVDKYADNVYRFIYGNIGHKEDARDIVQSSFEKLWKNRGKVKPETARPYLFEIAYNQMIDHLRKVKRIRLKGSFNESDGIAYQPSNESKKALDLALASLNEMQRSLVLLKDYEGYSYREIGEITRLNETQVKVYLHRARVQLKNFIGKKENIR